MKSRWPARLGAISVLTICASLACAHTVLESTTPESGSVLAHSPAHIRLAFIEPTRLTYLAIVSVEGERRIAFTPVGEAKAFTAAEPGLVAGRNEVQWRALSQDGHVVEGAIILVIRPPKP